jgi:membrane protein YqaA with SNARE-associated domain
LGGLVLDLSQNKHPLIRWFHRTAHSRYLPWALAGVVFTDFFVMVLPGDPCLAASVVANPAKSKRFWLSMVLGRLAAVAALGLLADQIPVETVKTHAAQAGMGDAWAKCESFFNEYGALSVALGALTPLPMFFLTLLAAVAGTSLGLLLLATGVGTGIRYAAIVLLTRLGLQLWPARGQRSKTSAHPETTT